MLMCQTIKIKPGISCLLISVGYYRIILDVTKHQGQIIICYTLLANYAVGSS
jgi:hypothetical protein